MDSSRKNEIIEKVLKRRAEVNARRFTKLIETFTQVVSLLDDETQKKCIIDKIKSMTDVPIKGTNEFDRNEILVNLRKLLPEIKDKIETNPLSEDCNQILMLIHEVIMHDFNKNKKSDIIGLFAENNISPISFFLEINENYDLSIIKKLQGEIRSKQRHKFHFSLFGKKPSHFLCAPDSLLLSKNILQCIHEISSFNLIISKIQYHWTTKSNLLSILRSKAFFGNKYLKQKKIYFQSNALEDADIKNGDSNVICFCPYLVDYLAFYVKLQRKIRSGTVRLAIDVSNIEMCGINNQFFKLFDLCSPSFNYSIRINDELLLTFMRPERAGSVYLIISLNNKKYRIEVFSKEKNSPHDVIFYGNLYSINRFCLIKFFSLLYNHDKNVYNEFINYLSKMTREEIKKILVSIGQTITIFSEFNMNVILPYNNKLVKSIHFVDKQITYNFSDNDEFDIQKLNELIISEETLSIASVNNEVCLSYIDEKKNNISLFGNIIEDPCGKKSQVKINQDLRNHPLEPFSTTHYIETRPC